VASAAWKDLERRVCRALGAERRPSAGVGGWARGSDDDGSAPFAVEVKRTKSLQLRGAWLEQARRNAKADGRPWLLVIGTHRSARPVCVLDFYELVALATEAGRIAPIVIEPEGGTMATPVVVLQTRSTTNPPPDEPAPGPEPAPDDDDDGDKR